MEIELVYRKCGHTRCPNGFKVMGNDTTTLYCSKLCKEEGKDGRLNHFNNEKVTVKLKINKVVGK